MVLNLRKYLPFFGVESFSSCYRLVANASLPGQVHMSGDETGQNPWADELGQEMAKWFQPRGVRTSQSRQDTKRAFK